MAPIPTPTDAPAASSAFPIAALGPLLSSSAAAVAAQTQAPVDLAAQHILTLAAMAAQRLIGLRLPTGAQRPVSCFFASLVGTGEGRGAVEKTIVDTVRLWERGFEDAFPMRVVAHIDEGVDTGVARPAPLQYLNLFYNPREPQAEDRYRSYVRQAGLFARHPHDLLQPGRPRREEAMSLCAIWNGKVLQRAAGLMLFPRLSLHLVTAPRTARVLLDDPELAESGVLGRLLVAAPASRIGARIYTLADSDEPPPAFTALLGALGALYERHSSAEFRVVLFSKPAAEMWLAYVREVEAAMAPGAAFASIRAFAGYVPEHAARLAAVIAFMQDCALEEIGEAHLAAGIALARYYTDVRLILRRLAPVTLGEAEKEELFKDWLGQRPKGERLRLRDVCRIGPPQLRDADTAYKLMRRMERLGIVQPTSAELAGAARPRRPNVRYAWKVQSDDQAEVSPGEVSSREVSSGEVSPREVSQSVA